jgi:hypothetical protein
VVNYSKEDALNLITIRNKPYYSLPMERVTDERFWAFFHQDWYQTAILKDLSCGQASVCAYRLYESKEGYALQ